MPGVDMHFNPPPSTAYYTLVYPGTHKLFSEGPLTRDELITHIQDLQKKEPNTHFIVFRGGIILKGDKFTSKATVKKLRTEIYH